jgi:hypothetical protein
MAGSPAKWALTSSALVDGVESVFSDAENEPSPIVKEFVTVAPNGT